MKNHYSIKPINCYVKESILYGNKSNKENLISCQIISLCLYENETLCFDILLNDGSIFNYIPFDKIVHNKIYDKSIQLKDLIYHNSKSLDISINKIKTLKNKKGFAYLKFKNEWITINKYYFSIDWYKGNDLLNLVKLDNGYFALLPNHKILFGNVKKELKKYIKIPETFMV